jgi:hypothetical protein
MQTSPRMRITAFELLRAWSANDKRAVEEPGDFISQPRNRLQIYKLVNRQPLQAFAGLIRLLFREEIRYRDALWRGTVVGDGEDFEGIHDCAFLLYRLGTQADRDLIAEAGRLNQDVGTMEEYFEEFEDPDSRRSWELRRENAIDMRTSILASPYERVASEWPASGRHILAQFDDSSIVVYQAFRSTIADFAVAHQKFGGEFSLSRMSWIKPNFLWMMYRSGWATKESQERILAVRLQSEFFEKWLERAVLSAFDPQRYPSQDAWQRAVENSDVRLQWDPDHDPNGRPVARRALQLGLRGAALEEYAEAAIVSIEDITAFVKQQQVLLNEPRQSLYVPRERVYVPGKVAAANVMLTASGLPASTN